jgi:hypothetical protein
MSDLIPSPVLLAILQNQIRNAVDNSKFPIYKTIGKASALTADEKNDISKNAYQFLIDSYGNLYVLDYHYADDDWAYYNFGFSTNYVLDYSGYRKINLKEIYYAHSDINGDIIYTNVIIDANDGYYASAYDVTLEADNYPGVFFQGNYFNDDLKHIYHFSSGIILDSSAETPQYKIVFASYDVNDAKVTFVEKVLP